MEPRKATAPACDAFLRLAGNAFHPRGTNRPPDQQLKPMKDTKRNARIEHARQLAQEHLATDKTLFHGSYPHPSHGYEVFSFTDIDEKDGIQIGLPEIINPNK